MGLPSDRTELNSPGSNSHGTPARPADGKPSATSNNGPSHPLTASTGPSSNPLTVSTAAETHAPFSLSAKTLRAQLNLVQKVFVKHDATNWIAHTCLIATDLDQARRQLQDDLYATDDASLMSRDLEETLSTRGFTTPRIDAFILKVLKVLDGIASADELEAGGPTSPSSTDDIPALEAELENALKGYPEPTRESMAAAAKVLEYLNRAKEEQEKKRLEVERRVGVLQGMVKIGEQVSKVVSFLLTDSQ